MDCDRTRQIVREGSPLFLSRPVRMAVIDHLQECLACLKWLVERNGWPDCAGPRYEACKLLVDADAAAEKVGRN